MEGKIGNNSENLDFKMILSEIRRKKLMELVKKLKNKEDQQQVVTDEITTPYSKIVRNILPDANFDWRQDKMFNNL